MVMPDCQKHIFLLCKKEKKYVQNSDVIEQSFISAIEQKFLNSEAALEIHKLLHNLDEPYKEVFILRLFGELSFVQITELFGKTESWAR